MTDNDFPERLSEALSLTDLPEPDYRDRLPEQERRRRNLGNFGTPLAPHDQLLGYVEEAAREPRPLILDHSFAPGDAEQGWQGQCAHEVFCAGAERHCGYPESQHLLRPCTGEASEVCFGVTYYDEQEGREVDLYWRLGEEQECLRTDEQGRTWVSSEHLLLMLTVFLGLGRRIRPGQDCEFWVE